MHMMAVAMTTKVMLTSMLYDSACPMVEVMLLMAMEMMILLLSLIMVLF